MAFGADSNIIAVSILWLFARIATVDLEMQVAEQAVGTTTDINRVGNAEIADQRGYVTPRLWSDSMFLPQM